MLFDQSLPAFQPLNWHPKFFGEFLCEPLVIRYAVLLAESDHLRLDPKIGLIGCVVSTLLEFHTLDARFNILIENIQQLDLIVRRQLFAVHTLSRHYRPCKQMAHRLSRPFIKLPICSPSPPKPVQEFGLSAFRLYLLPLS